MIDLDELVNAYEAARAISEKGGSPDPHRSGIAAVASRVEHMLEQQGRIIPDIPMDAFMILADDRKSVAYGKDRVWDVQVCFRDGQGGRRPTATCEGQNFSSALGEALRKGMSRKWTPPPRKTKK